MSATSRRQTANGGIIGRLRGGAAPGLPQWAFGRVSAVTGGRYACHFQRIAPTCLLAANQRIGVRLVTNKRPPSATLR
jgi:hypothetical protein